MTFRKAKQQPQFSDLIGILAQSKETENPLYQVVQEIINRLNQFQGITVENIADINNSINTIKSTVINLPPSTEPTDSRYYDIPLSDGNPEEADLIFANGECIIVQVPNI